MISKRSKKEQKGIRKTRDKVTWMITNKLTGTSLAKWTRSRRNKMEHNRRSLRLSEGLLTCKLMKMIQSRRALSWKTTSPQGARWAKIATNGVTLRLQWSPIDTISQPTRQCLMEKPKIYHALVTKLSAKLIMWSKKAKDLSAIKLLVSPWLAFSKTRFWMPFKPTTRMGTKWSPNTIPTNLVRQRRRCRKKRLQEYRWKVACIFKDKYGCLKAY